MSEGNASPAGDKVRVALVGFGYAGSTFHAPLLASTPGVELAAVVSSNPAEVRRRLPSARIASSVSEVVSDPEIDAVVIVVPNELHAQFAHESLDAGKHVVIDKPFATSLAETDALIEHAKAAGRKISVFQNRRWDGDFLTVRRLLNEGALGQLAEFESRFDRFRPVVQDRWREKPAPGAGIWFDLGPHLLDQALVLFGRPNSVFADIGMHRPGALVDDNFHVVLRYERLRVVLRSGVLASGRKLRFAAHGDAGSYRKWGLDHQEDQLKSGMGPQGTGWGVDRQHGVLSRPDHCDIEVPNETGSYEAFYAAFADAVINDREPPVTTDEIRGVMQIIELARESAAARREIQVAH